MKIISVLVLAMVLGVPVVSAEAPRVAGGVGFEAPAAWAETQPKSQMRLFQFEVSGAGDEAPAELAVFYFGAGQGGEAEANIERWKGQFNPLREGFSPEISRSEVNGLKVITVYLEGTYDSGVMMGAGGPQTDYAVLGAIVEGPKGPVFFKMIGPQATVSGAKPDFREFVGSFQPQS
ncbi:MAG: hypothetical protein Q8R76_00475 [Candidatus Omnitrophota bacterium]|nr:hypothetical protein [Candidatus Omnitrophota bacterium]